MGTSKTAKEDEHAGPSLGAVDPDLTGLGNSEVAAPKKKKQKLKQFNDKLAEESIEQPSMLKTSLSDSATIKKKKKRKLKKIKDELRKKGQNEQPNGLGNISSSSSKKTKKRKLDSEATEPQSPTKTAKFQKNKTESVTKKESSDTHVDVHRNDEGKEHKLNLELAKKH